MRWPWDCIVARLVYVQVADQAIVQKDLKSFENFFFENFRFLVLVDSKQRIKINKVNKKTVFHELNHTPKYQNKVRKGNEKQKTLQNFKNMKIFENEKKNFFRFQLFDIFATKFFFYFNSTFNIFEIILKVDLISETNSETAFKLELTFISPDKYVLTLINRYITMSTPSLNLISH